MLHQRIVHESLVWSIAPVPLYNLSWGDCCNGGANTDHDQIACNRDFPSTWEEAFHKNIVEIEDQHKNSKITIGTWNVNALTPHVHEILALDADVIALQEVRIGEDSVPSIRATFKQFGYNLYIGTLPNYKTQGHNKKSIHLDQTIPGVAFVVKCHIPVQEFRLDAMTQWVQNGRLYAIQTFAQQKWITCFNAYAPTQNSAPFLDELSQTLGEYAHQSSILFGDINADSRCGLFIREMNDNGWYSLTQDTNYDFYSYKHSNGNTSCIDLIAVTDLLKETVAPIQSTHVLNKGHSFLSTSMHSSFQQKPTWEVYHQVCFCVNEDNDDQWQQVLASHRSKMHTTTLDQDWSIWCETLQTVHNPEGAVIGLQPRFRLRDQFKHSKLHEQLSHAIKTQDWQTHTTILSKLQQISKNQLRKWRQKIQKKGQSQHEWTKNLFRWARAAPPPIPSCIESKKYGKEGYTTCLQDSLHEITDYFSDIYKSKNAIQDEQNVLRNDYKCNAAQILDINCHLQKVISTADASKVAGMDGLEIAHLKQLPPTAVLFLAHIFHKSLHQRRVPLHWLNCKMTCIPKKQGKTSVKNLRPLTISPVCYRIFCKTLLVMNNNAQQNIPEHSIGGVIGRAAFHAWLPAALMCEATWRIDHAYRDNLQGVAIDTEKFFDNVPIDKACDTLLHIGLPYSVVTTWHFMITHVKRFASLNGSISKNGFKAAVGIPQGDPLSMLAAAALLGEWTREIPHDHILAKVFVDDRLMLSNDNSKLQEAFHATQFWDGTHEFQTQAKTVAFGTNPECENLWWLEAYEIKRQKQIEYLGVLLPLKGSSTSEFYKPILQKCYVVLNKLARSHITHDNAISIVARKIVPAICYPCSVARPTKAQMDNLRSKIFEATAFRKCQTQAAHSVFCERTHHFDPESAMVYHNMRFWRQVFVQAPWFAQQLKDLLDQSIPPKQDLLGPLTLFQKDIAWLNCRFVPDSDALCSEDNDCILFTEPDKRKFEHFIREQIRKHFYKHLEQKHPKWQGVANADLHATTKLLRGLEPSSPFRNPIIRLLSDAHATSHRLCHMRIKATPHCQYCLNDDGTIQHVLWDCPRFAELRKEWPLELNNRHNWPPCAKNAMICTTFMPEKLRTDWHKLQLSVAQLLWQWMEMNREPDLYQQFAPEQQPPGQVSNNTIARTCQQKRDLGFINALPLKWNPPVTRTEWNKWGSTPQDFALVFSFWTKWTQTQHSEAIKIFTWTQVLALFVRHGGAIADFLQQCQFAGMAAYKLRVLSSFVFQTQHQNSDLNSLDFSNQNQAKWLESFPNETAFPDGLFFIPQWNLTQANTKLQALRVEARLTDHVNAQIVRIPTASFCESVGQDRKLLMSTPLSEKWQIPRFRNKNLPFPWIQQVLQKQQDVATNCLTTQATCVTQLPLEKWKSLSSLEIRNALPSKPGPLKRFKAARNRTAKFKDVLERYQQNQILENDLRTHVLEPVWTSFESCASCGKLLSFSTEPRNLTRRCPRPRDFDVQLLNTWSAQYDSMLSCLDAIVDKLS